MEQISKWQKRKKAKTKQQETQTPIARQTHAPNQQQPRKTVGHFGIGTSFPEIHPYGVHPDLPTIHQMKWPRSWCLLANLVSSCLKHHPVINDSHKPMFSFSKLSLISVPYFSNHCKHQHGTVSGSPFHETRLRINNLVSKGHVLCWDAS